MRRSFFSALGFVLLASSLSTPVAFALFLDGNGSYSLRGETNTAPAASNERGSHEAIDQHFRLLGEIRGTEKSSFLMELRIFDKPREAYLGDTAKPATCAEGNDASCDKATQNTSTPGYRPYTPFITKAYVRYASDYCLLEAGRRGRDWGMGLLYDSGESPFSEYMSVFDGVTCDINLQKSQNIGFSIGADKIVETGTPLPGDTSGRTYGASRRSDDINQIFMSIQMDDRESNKGAAINKSIGLHGVNMQSPSVGDGGSGTDLYLLDLYVGLFFSRFTFKNEMLFRRGKTADANTTRFGGADQIVVGQNSMQAAGIAGSLQWYLDAGGAYIGPEPYMQGDAHRHVIFFDYAYTPGDSDGYYNNPVTDNPLSTTNRDHNATALAFNSNFKPALIMFNGRPETDDLRVDGIFDPNAVMNAQVFGLGYRYEDLNLGNFEFRLVTANLNEGMPTVVHDYYDSQTKKIVGYYGKSLGYELDLKYSVNLDYRTELGFASAVLLPGKAWQVSEKGPTNSYLVQSYITFKF